MEIADEVTIIPEGRDQNRHSAGLLPGSREWYFRASAEFSSCVVSHELERITRYTIDADTHARNLSVLWMTDPFPEDIFVREAQSIVDKSNEIGDIVTSLKNTTVRFLHVPMPDVGKRPGSPMKHRRLVRRRSATGRLRKRDPGHQCGGAP